MSGGGQRHRYAEQSEELPGAAAGAPDGAEEPGCSVVHRHAVVESVSHGEAPRLASPPRRLGLREFEQLEILITEQPLRVH
jgi:hypothetical protein